jgi:hypothetical protein
MLEPENTVSSRKHVFDCITSEREYQDLTAQNWNHKGHPSIAAELLMMEEYLLKARTAYCGTRDDAETLDVLRKIAGIAVRCLENYGVAPRPLPIGFFPAPIVTHLENQK